MPVYLIRAGDHGPVKIGYSEDVFARLVKMRADNHERLIILRLFEGGRIEEAMLHDRFADNWLHGEWFSFAKAMLGDLGLQDVRLVADEPFSEERELARQIDELTALHKKAAQGRPPAPEPTAQEYAQIAAEIDELTARRRKAA